MAVAALAFIVMIQISRHLPMVVDRPFIHRKFLQKLGLVEESCLDFRHQIANQLVYFQIARHPLLLLELEASIRRVLFHSPMVQEGLNRIGLVHYLWAPLHFLQIE